MDALRRCNDVVYLRLPLINVFCEVGVFNYVAVQLSVLIED